MANIPPETGIILVDHGSTLESANEMLEEVAREFSEATGLEIVEPAHMELAEPRIEQAFARCVERGAKQVVILLYFLSPGRHSMRDIPSMAAEAAADFPGVPYWVSAPLGVDLRMNDVLLRRAEEALAEDAWTENGPAG